MSVAYHATTPENARRIRIEGFREGTWFAHRREDAEHFGSVVLAAEFPDDPDLWHNMEPGGWQFWLREPLPPSVILAEPTGEKES